MANPTVDWATGIITIPQSYLSNVTGTLYELDTDVLRFKYESLATPITTYGYNMNNKEREMLKQDEVVGKFDPKKTALVAGVDFIGIDAFGQFDRA